MSDPVISPGGRLVADLDLAAIRMAGPRDATRVGMPEQPPDLRIYSRSWQIHQDLLPCRYTLGIECAAVSAGLGHRGVD